ncbi:hypothetical protein EK21DRAFT_113149 [Setomelanomma holmii]|uniref:Uncharacterized protein n=1 Tax=Setomelanomma holmii TaxID=210430 RepID=A0A9P4H9V8_9PLEO|nr:hypothetical protein EK21DRAFT_113149 [Setomelanomma holmii]
MSLLELPTETRLQTYTYIVPNEPLKVPSKQFSGILYSCMTIRNELEPEICKAMTACLDKLAHVLLRRSDELFYTPPTTLRGWLNLTVSRPKTKNMFCGDDPYLDFKCLHFNTLTITFHNDTQGYEKCRPFGEYPAMESWILDWRKYPLYGSGYGVEGSLKADSMHAWEAEIWTDEKGVTTGVWFYRKEMESLWTMWIED